MLQEGLVSHIHILIEKKPPGSHSALPLRSLGRLIRQQGGYRTDMVKFCVVQNIAQPTRLFSLFPWLSGTPTSLSSGETLSVNRFGIPLIIVGLTRDTGM